MARPTRWIARSCWTTASASRTSRPSFFHDIPYKRYVFEFRSAGGNAGGGGGLEHLGSTEIFLRGQIEDRVRSVIAHEFFHLWNVKRIRPFVLGPFDYIDPPRTHNLWWSEGVTSYYGDLLSRRGGLNTDQEYFKHLSELITDLQNNPARLKVSGGRFELACLGGEQQPGLRRAELLHEGRADRSLPGRADSQGDQRPPQPGRRDKGLVRAVRAGKGPGFGEDDIRTWTSRVAGKDLSGFYDLLARSTQEMPHRRVPLLVRHQGERLRPARRIHPSLGMSLAPSRTGTGLRVAAVEQGGAAESAGIKQGDVVIAIDGKPADFEAFGRLRSARTHAKFTLTVQRDGQNRRHAVRGRARRRGRPGPSHRTQGDARTARLREAWLNGR